MAAPTALFAGFTDPDAPVLCFAGPGIRTLARDARRLFALLRSSGAPAVLRRTVCVVSRSEESAAVFTLNETDQNVARYAAIARTMGEDLVGERPACDELRWTVRKPLLVFAKERIPPAPQAYIEGRFGADPSKPTPAHRLARAFWAIDHRQRALEILERACVSSTDALDHFHFGLCLNEADRAGAAVPCLRRACELAPDVADPFFELGLTLVQLGDYPGAADAFERAAAAAPDDFGIWANLAQVYKLIGSEPAMRRAARRAQELEPGEPLTAALLR